MSLISDQDKTVPVTVQTRALLCGLAGYETATSREFRRQLRGR
jgi:hypothetical protein